MSDLDNDVGLGDEFDDLEPLEVPAVRWEPSGSQRRHQLLISGHPFATKQDLHRYVSALVHGTKKTEIVPAVHWPFLMGFFSMHPHWEEKRGNGVVGFLVGHGEYNNPCFLLVKRGGLGSTDISFHAVLNNIDWRNQRLKGRTSAGARADVRAALRWEVTPGIEVQKELLYFGADRVPSAISGVLMARNECHMDHTPPLTFEALATAWLESRSLSEANIAIQSGDNLQRHLLVDRALAADWIAFHDARVKLRPVTAEENYQVAAEQRR